MSVPFYGDYDTTETVYIPFNTFSSDDPSASVTITNLVAGDVEIHKDGGTAQRSSDNGVTVTIDFDSVTGNHLVSIDLSDNSDAGFYANGSRYQVRMEGTTVDGGTINAWIGSFSIGCTLRPTTAGRTLTVESDGVAHADVKEWGGTAIASAISAANLAKLEDILDGTGGTGFTLSSIVITGAATGISVTGTTAGVSISGGTTGIGLDINGGSTSGEAVDIDSTSGAAVSIGAFSGVALDIESGDNTAIDIVTQAGSGVKISGTTHGIECAASGGPGVEIDGTTFGIEVDASAGPGLHVGGTTYGTELTASAGPGLSAVSTGGNGAGLIVAGNGSGHGLSTTGGATGHGVYAYGGATSGDGIYAAGQTAGDGMTLVGAGASQYGLNADVHSKIDTIDGIVDAILVDTGTTLPATLSTHEGKIDAIKAKTDNLKDSWNDVSSDQVNAACDTALADYDPPTKAELDSGLAGLNDPTANAVRDAVWSQVIETGLTAKQAMAVMVAAEAGKLSGAATSVITVKAAQEETTTRITATVDGDGNRSNVVLNLP